VELDPQLLEESAAELLNEVPCGYLATLPDGRIIQVNDMFLKWTGHTREELLSGKQLKDLFTLPGRIYHDTHIGPLLQMQGHVREVAFDLVCATKTVLPVFLSCVQKKGPDGSVVLVRVMVFAATDRRQYERELLEARRIADQATLTERAAREESERANRAKDEFMALVSHELRAPLSAILGWSQLLKRKAAGNTEVEHGLEVIERNTRLQARLVDDLLDMSRILSGKLRLDVQRVDLASVIEAALETTRPAAEARAVRLQKVLDPAVVVSGDPARLQQVFWNLLSNAVKFTPGQGHVRIVMERVNSHVEVSVIDSGQGMTAEFLRHAFERFRQSDSKSARESGGLGLGLSIVKNVTEMHGGSVEAHSEGEGRGSTFVVKLPILVLHGRTDEGHVHPRAALSSTPDEAISVSLKGLSIVLIDDEDDARELLHRVLTDAGARVIATGSALQALQEIERTRPDILISDIGMPEIDGYELMRRVRMLGHGSATRAIALTAFSRLEDRTRAMLAGFQMHLTKPVDPRELVVTVASLAGRLTEG
jgi:PAS domain S-box-containing protein